VDIVRSQILIAQGHKLHDEPLALPMQEKIPLYGAALQCRVTTEDPAKNFAPDYGKLHVSVSGWIWHPSRRRDGLCRSGARGLLRFAAGEGDCVGTNLNEACQRMDRACANSAFAV